MDEIIDPDDVDTQSPWSSPNSTSHTMFYSCEDNGFSYGAPPPSPPIQFPNCSNSCNYDGDDRLDRDDDSTIALLDSRSGSECEDSVYEDAFSMDFHSKSVTLMEQDSCSLKPAVVEVPLAIPDSNHEQNLSNTNVQYQCSAKADGSKANSGEQITLSSMSDTTIREVEESSGAGSIFGSPARSVIVKNLESSMKDDLDLPDLRSVDPPRSISSSSHSERNGKCMSSLSSLNGDKDMPDIVSLVEFPESSFGQASTDNPIDINEEQKAIICEFEDALSLITKEFWGPEPGYQNNKETDPPEKSFENKGTEHKATAFVPPYRPTLSQKKSSEPFEENSVESSTLCPATFSVANLQIESPADIDQNVYAGVDADVKIVNASTSKNHVSHKHETSPNLKQNPKSSGQLENTVDNSQPNPEHLEKLKKMKNRFENVKHKQASNKAQPTRITRSTSKVAQGQESGIEKAESESSSSTLKSGDFDAKPKLIGTSSPKSSCSKTLPNSEISLSCNLKNNLEPGDSSLNICKRIKLELHLDFDDSDTIAHISIGKQEVIKLTQEKDRPEIQINKCQISKKKPMKNEVKIEEFEDTQFGGCPICGKTGFKSQQSRYFHKQSHENIMCSFPGCNKRYSRKTTLNKHIKACHTIADSSSDTD